jgi:hypothetical protein
LTTDEARRGLGEVGPNEPARLIGVILPFTPLAATLGCVPLPGARVLRGPRRSHGVPTLRGVNRAHRGRDIEPCPPEKREAIEEALRHFGAI